MTAARSRLAAPESDLRDDPTRWRLRLVGAALVLPLLVTLVRIAHVQLVLPPRFEQAWTATTERIDPTPARTGRLIAADGVVLAHDRSRLDLEMHYRWLEQPPDADWLRQEVASRLRRSDRRDAVQQASMRATVLRERRDLHAALGQMFGVDEFESRRIAIQDRITRMRRVVMDRRAASVEVAETEATDERPFLVRCWSALTTELATPPRRTEDRFVIAEEVGYHPLVGDIPAELATAIEASPRRFRGLRVATTLRREYPLGDLAAQVVGYRRAAIDDSNDSNDLGDPNRMRGEAGIERSYDRQLTGTRGQERVTLDWAGREQATVPIRPAQNGRDLTLTIHSRWQRVAESILDDALAGEPAPGGGCLLVMNCWTGEMRVAAAGPRVDPNLYATPDPERWARLQSDPRRPFFPRLTRMALPPGSTFKTLTAAAAVEAGYDPQAPFDCRGYRSQPDRERCAIFVSHGVGHGEIDLTAALGQSCNVLFFDLADRLGERELVDWADRAGFGWTTGCDLPGESAGNLPRGGTPAETAARRRQLAIGQGGLTATPLQMVRWTAAIANGGRLVRPHFAAGSDSPPEPLNLSPITLKSLRDGMVAAVASPGGTARGLSACPIPIAGKTGTAQTGRTHDDGRPKTHAWFTGFFPADDPRYAVVAVLENGGTGGTNAAPMVGQWVTTIAARGGFD